MKTKILLSLIASALLVIPSNAFALYPWQSNAWKNTCQNETVRNFAIGAAACGVAYGLYSYLTYKKPQAKESSQTSSKRQISGNKIQEQLTQSFGNVPVTFVKTLERTSDQVPGVVIQSAKLDREPKGWFTTTWHMRYIGHIAPGNGSMYSYAIEANKVPDKVFDNVVDFMKNDFEESYEKLANAAQAEARPQQPQRRLRTQRLQLPAPAQPAQWSGPIIEEIE